MKTMFDAHVRLRAEELTQVRPQHLFSSIEDASTDDAASPCSDVMQGTTEWVAEGPRQLTFGWDWTYEPASWRLAGRWSSLRTNLMVVDDTGADMGVNCLRLCVARLMTRARWDTALTTQLHLHRYK